MPIIAYLSALDLAIAIEELSAYGTSEGVRKEWDERGRGRKEVPEAALPGTSSTSDNPTEQYFKNLAVRFGYDPNKVHISNEPKQFTLSGQSYDYAGGANLQTGEITIWPDKAAGAEAPIMAHEVMHQQYEKVLQAYRDERMLWIEVSRQQLNNHGGPTRPEDVMTTNGFFNHTPTNDSRFPIISRFDDVQDGIQNTTSGGVVFKSEILHKDDGCTPYSKSWWDAWGQGKAQTSQAMHETVSEIARLTFENKGTIPKTVSPAWKAYYQAVVMTYQDLKRNPKWGYLMKEAA